MSTSLIQQADATMFRRYAVALRTTARLCGGIPRNDELVRTWLKARTGYDDAETDAQEEQTRAEMAATITEGEQAVWTSFAADEKGIYMHERTVHAMLKENAKIVGLVKANPGLGQILQHACHVRPACIYLGRMQADGFEDKPVHVMGPRGPRTALKRYDYAAPPVEAQFTITVVRDGKGALLSLENLAKILTNAQYSGWGANRSQGFGTFEVTRLEEIL